MGRIVTSAERLASLMFQLQLTGYMFKNAEYRMAISKSIQSVRVLLPADHNKHDKVVHGKVKVKYPNQDEMEVEADAYVSELRSEIKRLREEMLASQKYDHNDDQ